MIPHGDVHYMGNGLASVTIDPEDTLLALPIRLLVERWLSSSAASACVDARRTGAEAGLSRSTLTDRFARYLGQGPMAYLADWRLELAAPAHDQPQRATDCRGSRVRVGGRLRSRLKASLHDTSGALSADVAGRRRSNGTSRQTCSP